MKLVRKDDAKALAFQKSKTAMPQNILTHDAASVIFTDDDGKRWRLPKNTINFDGGGAFGRYLRIAAPPYPGKHTICVRVVDVFGCDTSLTLEVES